MLKLIISLVCALQVVYGGSLVKRQMTRDDGDYVLICKHEPIDLGIVLDSSSSIYPRDFTKSLVFLQNFLEQFQIGNGRNDVRVSIITFGKGIYKDQSFNLDTYTDKEDLIAAVGRIYHHKGLYTDTGKGIAYMADVQLAPAVTRDYAEKVGIVLTDGNSQEWRYTEEAAQKARNDGIKLFAVGVGRGVRYEELLRIAGTKDRVTTVKNYDSLKNIVKILAKETCIRKPKPTTQPPPPTVCGEENPADVNFLFSPADMGHEGTVWSTEFIAKVVDNQDMATGFRFGVVSGSCPEDEGFALDKYNNAELLKRRLNQYDRYRLGDLVAETLENKFTRSNGGRSDARDIAVLVVTEENAVDIPQDVNELVNRGVQVFIANPYDADIPATRATILSGPGSVEAAHSFVSAICG